VTEGTDGSTPGRSALPGFDLAASGGARTYEELVATRVQGLDSKNGKSANQIPAASRSRHIVLQVAARLQPQRFFSFPEIEA